VTDPKELVRRGYDALSYQYRGDGDDDPGERREWIERLTTLVDPAAHVLDLGCGCGVPVSRALVAAGLRVTGVDLSDVQIGRARTLVPGASFIRADASEVGFAPGTFDAVVCLYMLIHLPMDEQPALLAKLASWIRPGGLLVATTGHQAWTGTSDNWLGGDTTMWWSHADAATYAGWLTTAGFAIEAEEFVPEGSRGHSLFWCRVENSGAARPDVGSPGVVT
jgi:2-polyprenyl-3-methyl-5-hydroxy-6-metoxy-1,4-benzoquinol methylase